MPEESEFVGSDEAVETKEQQEEKLRVARHEARMAVLGLITAAAAGTTVTKDAASKIAILADAFEKLRPQRA